MTGYHIANVVYSVEILISSGMLYVWLLVYKNRDKEGLMGG